MKRWKHLGHDVMIPSFADDVRGGTVAIGYPDETLSFEQFARELQLIARGIGQQTSYREAVSDFPIIVDFESRTEEEADRALTSSWGCPVGFAIGTFSTHSVLQHLNAQNERIRRHITMIAPGTTMNELLASVVCNVTDSRSCPDPDCAICPARPRRTIIDVIRILCDALKCHELQLFSRWAPGPLLRFAMERSELELRHFHLDQIPSETLESNRWYTTWFGTPRQATEFWRTIWMPGL